MKELLDEIEMLYKYFNNENYLFFAIFLLSIIYIFSIEKNKKIKDFFVGYSVFILIIIWNPICIYFFNKMINIGAMYRIYYMLPTCITIAYAGTKIIENCKNTINKLLSLMGLVIIIATYGNCIFNTTSTIKVGNYYKLPDESVEVAYIISADKETDYKKAIVPYGMSSHIRQISPDIQLCFSRVISNPKDENGNDLPHDTDDPSFYEPVVNHNNGNVEYITKLCIESGINYVVFPKTTKLSHEMEDYGFERYEETREYIIYRRIEF